MALWKPAVSPSRSRPAKARGVLLVVAMAWSIIGLVFMGTAWTSLAAPPSTTAPLNSAADNAAPTRIGVLAHKGTAVCKEMWEPTMAYLSRTIPGRRFELVPLNFDEVEPAVRSESIDFLICHAAMYVDMEVKYGVSRIMTLRNRVGDQIVSEYGGVIFCRSDRTDVRRLSDVPGKRLAAVDRLAFGGWLMALREFKAAGINPERDCARLFFLDTHADVVRAVLSGAADVGTVRTDTIERMVANGELRMDAIRVIPADSLEARGSVYPYVHSTRLYPEWPLAKLHATSDALAAALTVSLLSMPAESPAALAAESGGWGVCLNYTSVHDCLRELRVTPYENYGRIGVRELWRQHRSWIVVIGFLVPALVAALLLVRARQRALLLIGGRNRLILQSAGEGIIGVDASGLTTFVNPAAERLLGYSADELLGRGLHDLTHHTKPDGSPYPRHECPIYAAFRDGVVHRGDDERFYRKDGTAFPITYSSRPIFEEGKVTGAVVCFRDIAAQKHAQEAVRRSEMKFRTLYDSTSDAVMLLDEKGFFDCNQATLAMFGCASLEEFCSKHPADVSPPGQPCGTDSMTLANLRIATAMDKGSHRFEWTHKRIDTGQSFPAEVLLNAMELDGKQVLQAVVRDMTDARRAGEKLRNLSRVVEQTPASVVITNTAGDIEYVNPAFTQATGYTAEEALGKNPRILKSGLTAVETYAEMWRELTAGRDWRGEIQNRRKNGELFWELAVISPLRDSRGKTTHYLSIKENITLRKAMEDELRSAARTDKLTGLPNRALICDRLQQAVLRANRVKEYRFAVLFLDFDRFKTINDSLGHEVGDMLLQEIARRLRTAVRAGDSLSWQACEHTAARLGGDEFVVLLDSIASPEDATVVADRLLKVLSEPYCLGEHEVYSSASIGIVTSETATQSAEAALRDADTAMYEAKLAGKGRYVVFDVSMHDRVKSRLSLENDLRKAVDAGELFLVYQPIVSLQTGRIESFEALVRWQHPRRGPIPPGEFIPIAEDTGLILPIGEWVLRQACRQFAQWRQSMGKAAPRSISVNLSRKQLMLPNLPATIRQILEQTGVPARSLHLEITESAVMRDTDAATRMLHAIKNIGVKLDLDDFGTGYSSLACLHQFPIDVLKIDRSFVANIDRGRDFAALVNAVAQLARNLNIQVVAEGIETVEQALMLQSLDCEFGQGYLFSKPLPADRVAGFKVSPALLPGQTAAASERAA